MMKMYRFLFVYSLFDPTVNSSKLQSIQHTEN